MIAETGIDASCQLPVRTLAVFMPVSASASVLQTASPPATLVSAVTALVSMEQEPNQASCLGATPRSSDPVLPLLLPRPRKRTPISSPLTQTSSHFR